MRLLLLDGRKKKDAASWLDCAALLEETEQEQGLGVEGLHFKYSEKFSP